jgi:hypothetical protein
MTACPASKSLGSHSRSRLLSGSCRRKPCEPPDFGLVRVSHGQRERGGEAGRTEPVTRRVGLMPIRVEREGRALLSGREIASSDKTRLAEALIWLLASGIPVAGRRLC